MWQVILNSLKSFLGKFLKSAAQKQLSVLMPIANDAVTMVANDVSILTSSEKRNYAFDIIKDQISVSQKDISTSLINLAIELAYQEIKMLSGK